MKKHLLIFFTLFLTISMNAQLGIKKKKMSEAKLIKELPLLVVLHEYDDPFYKKMNVMLKESMGKYWTFSDSIKFITKKELREFSKDKSKKDKYAYLMYSEKEYQANVPAGVFCIGLLKNKTFTHFKKFGNPNKELSLADYKLGLFWLQKDLTLRFGIGAVSKRAKILIKEFKERMSQDTLLIDKDLINDEIKESLAKDYKYNYKIVSKEIIDNAILDELPNILYLKSFETLSRPITRTRSSSINTNIGAQGTNRQYHTTNTKSSNVYGNIMSSIYRADNQQYLISTLANSEGITITKYFKKLLKAIE